MLSQRKRRASRTLSPTRSWAATAIAAQSLSVPHQPCDHHDLAAREFERVVVDVRIVHINLPEPCDLVIHARFPEKAARGQSPAFLSTGRVLPVRANQII